MISFASSFLCAIQGIMFHLQICVLFSHVFNLFGGLQHVSLQLERSMYERLNISDVTQPAEVKRPIPVLLICVKKHG